MISLAEKNEIMEAFNKEVDSKVDSARRSIYLFDYFKAGAYEEFKKSMKYVKSVLDGSLTADLKGKLDIRLAYSFMDSYFTVTMKAVKNREAVRKAKFTVVVRKDTSNMTMFDEIFGQLRSFYTVMVEGELAEVNVEKLNEVFADIVKRAGVSYSVGFVSSAMAGGCEFISEISDERIVFVCDESRIFDVGSITAMMEASEFVSEETISENKDVIAQQIAMAQSPIELLGDKDQEVIDWIIGKTTQNTVKIVRRLVSKNLSNTAKKMAPGRLYYYVDDDVFAVVRENEGKLDSVIAPVDRHTLKRVEFDVAGAVGLEA